VAGGCVCGGGGGSMGGGDGVSRYFVNLNIENNVKSLRSAVV